MRIPWTRLALLVASCLSAGSAVAVNFDATNHTTRFVLLQNEDTDCTNHTAAPDAPAAAGCFVYTNNPSATYTNLSNDYYGTISYVGSSTLTGGTNTWMITVDPVTWGKTLAPTLAAANAALGTTTGLTLLFDQTTGNLASPSPSWTASAVYTVSPGVTLGLTLTGLPDPTDEPYFGAPAAVGSTPPGPPYGPPLTLSCAWNLANYPTPGSSQGPGPVTPASLCSSQVAPPGYNLVSGTDLTGFGETTINITGVTQSEADAVWTALKWKIQEMACFYTGCGGPVTMGAQDTDGDGIPDPPAGYGYSIPTSTGTTPNGYPVTGYFDNCPFAANPTQSDVGGFNSSVPNGIGDACECGDANNDGTVTGPDATAITRALGHLVPYGAGGTANLGKPAGSGVPKCDANGDGSCAGPDATAITRKLGGLSNGYKVGRCHAATTFP